MKIPDGGVVIRTGCESKEAWAEVVLNNAGPPGSTFQPHLYGDQITLTRVIKAAIGETKAAAAGKVNASLVITGSRKTGVPYTVKGNDAKAELTAMCSFFNIAQDNPVMVMDQETSKKFLTGNSQDQYDYFLRATNLKSMHTQVCEISERLIKADDYLATHKGSMAACEAYADEKEKEWKEVQALSKFGDRVREAELDLIWASYQDSERSGEGKSKEAEASQKNMDEARSRLEKVCAAQLMYDAKVETATAALEVAKDRSLEVMETLNAAKKRVSATLGPVQSRAKALKTATEAEAKAAKALENAQKRLQNVEDQIAAATAQSKLTKAQQAKETAIARNASAEEAVKEAEAAVEEKLGAVETVSQSCKSARVSLESARAGVASARERWKRLKEAKTEAEPLTAYIHSPWNLARDAAQIAELIRSNARSFNTPPKGPLGSLLRLKDTDFSSVIELYAKNSLLNFVCESVEDARALECLVRDRSNNPRLIHSLNFSVHSPDKPPPVSVQDPPPGSLLSLLTFDDKATSVVSAVCSSMKAHSTMVCKEAIGVDGGLAALKASKGSFLDVLCPDGHGKGGYLKIGMSRGGGSAFTERLQRKFTMGGFIRCVSAAAEIAGAKASLSAAEDACSTEEMAFTSLELSLKTAEGELRVATKTHKDAVDNLKRAKSAVGVATLAVKAAEDAAEESLEDESRRSEAQSAVEAANDRLELVREAVGEAKKELDGVKGPYEEAEEALKAASKAGEFLEEGEAAKALKDAEEAREKVSKARVQFEEKFEVAEENAARAKSAWDAFKGNLEVSRAQCRNATGWDCPRPGSEGLTVFKAKGALNAIKKKEEHERNRLQNVDVEVVRKAFKDAQAKLAGEKSKYEEVHKNYELLKINKKTAQQKFRDLRDRSCEDIEKSFTSRLVSKGHKGTLEFRHNKESDQCGEVVLKVIADASASGKMGLSAKESGSGAAQLSGGEKSLISLILLSAIANVSNPPFRVIDEFDVFQDEGTRKKSLQYLMEDAGREGEDGKLTQYILLTPHDVANVGKDYKLDVKTFTMPGELLSLRDLSTRRPPTARICFLPKVSPPITFHTHAHTRARALKCPPPSANRNVRAQKARGWGWG